MPPDWLAEFEAAARHPLAQRFRYAFVRTYKLVPDDARYRSFESLENSKDAGFTIEEFKNLL